MSTVTTSLFLLWTLLSFLLIWMVVFTLLALRPAAKDNVDVDDFTTRHYLVTLPPKSQTLATDHIQPYSGISHEAEATVTK